MTSFSALSPQLRREQLGPADTWPVSGVVWDVTARALHATARHHAAKVDVSAIELQGHTLQASLALFWACFAGRLQRLDWDALLEHASSFDWPTYQEALEALLRWAAPASPSLRQELQHEAAAALVPFKEGALRDLTFTEFLQVLAPISRPPSRLEPSECPSCTRTCCDTATKGTHNAIV